MLTNRNHSMTLFSPRIGKNIYQIERFNDEMLKK